VLSGGRLSVFRRKHQSPWLWQIFTWKFAPTRALASRNSSVGSIISAFSDEIRRKNFRLEDYSSRESQVSSLKSQVPSPEFQVPSPNLRTKTNAPGFLLRTRDLGLGILGLGTYCSISNSCGGATSRFLRMRSSISVHSALREASCMSDCACCIFSW